MTPSACAEASIVGRPSADGATVLPLLPAQAAIPRLTKTSAQKNADHHGFRSKWETIVIN